MIAIRGILLNIFFIKPVYSQTIKWQMGCHWHSGLITGHDDAIALVGVRVSE